MSKQLVLALDTASEHIALAVGTLDGLVLACDDHPARRAANTQLMPSIDALFTAQGLRKQDIACVVCGRGPGSFTGVRIAIATAKGLAYGLGVPLFGVSTLEAIAWGAHLAGIRGTLGVVADAMRGEVYPARFELNDRLNDEHNGQHGDQLNTQLNNQLNNQRDGMEKGALVVCRDAHTVIKADVLAEQWRESNEPLILVGDGLQKFGSLFTGAVENAVGDNSKNAAGDNSKDATRDAKKNANKNANAPFTFAPESLWMPTGRGLLHAFWAKYKMSPDMAAIDGAFQLMGNPTDLLPIYTRLSDAEENERKRLASDGAITQGALVEVFASGVANPALYEQVMYRPMASCDLDHVARLEAQVFSDGGKTPATSGECWTSLMFADELPRADRSWWVAYKGDTLVGFAGGWVIDGQLQILDIAITPAYRRQGIGRKLISRLVEDASVLGATSITLEVRASNMDAQAFYAALGLECKAVRPRYYAPRRVDEKREDALIFSRDDSRRRHEKQVQPSASLRVSPHISPCAQPRAETHVSPCAQPCVSPCAQPHAETRVSPYAQPRILAIETSCDETAATVMNGDGQLLSNVIASQTDFHARFGGVVPEIASRKHIENILGVVDAALVDAASADIMPEANAAPEGNAASEANATPEANATLSSIDAIAVTYAPGLIGALVVGVAFAKGLSWATGKPLIKVNHLEGHIYSNRLDNPELEPPFVIALLSGGNTMLVHVRAWGEYRILGQTLDDAVGETFDKVAKALGLGYPGGPVISSLAKTGSPTAIKFPRALINSKDFHFSLSGLKTAVITYIRQEQEAGRALNLPDLAASFQQAVIDVQIAKAIDALEQTGAVTFCLGGGVAANRALRAAYQKSMEPRGIRVVAPARVACTDNAAMIAAVALDRYKAGRFAALDDDASANADLEQPY